MKKQLFSGSCVALATPMKADGSIHYGVLEQLLEDQLAGGTDAILVAGTTGEGATLSRKERAQLIRHTAGYIRGKIPVIAGAGSNDTAQAVALTKDASQAGADALMYVTPYYNKTSQEGLYRHFLACAGATDLPVMVYNVPSRTGVTIEINTYLRLAEIENLSAVKEASGNCSYLARIAAACKDALDIYIGNDDLIVPALSLGAKGVISVMANIIPKETHLICQRFFDGDIQKSKDLQLYYLELAGALFSDVNPIPVKQALRFMGYQAGSCRLPLCDMSEPAQGKLLDVLQRYGLLPAKQRLGD